MRDICAPVALTGLTLAAVGQAGDYALTVADDPSSACAAPARRRTPSWPVASGAEIARDVVRYFDGQETGVSLFGAAFGNGVVTFCGANERREVYEAFVRVATTGPKAHAAHLDEFAMMLGSQQLMDIIDTRLQDVAVPQAGARRLRRMREAVRASVAVRTRAGSE